MEMARLFPAKTINTGSSTLKGIDPLDCLGDGSNVLLVEEDRAIVFNHEGKIVFYSLHIRTGGGNVDVGFDEIVPTNNQGDWYWKCRGYTKSTFLGAVSGETFYASENSSNFAPDGFTGGTTPYSESTLVPANEMHTDYDYSWYGTGMYDDKTFVALNSGYLYIDHSDSSVTTNFSYNEPNDYDYYWNPIWGTDDASVIKYIVDLNDFADVPTKLSRFDMSTLQHTAIDLTFPSGWTSWAVDFGSARYISCFAYGVYGYFFGSSTGKGVKINILTGVMDWIDNIGEDPDSSAAIAPDYDNDLVYVVAAEGADNPGRVWEYDITQDTFTQLISSGPTNIDTYAPAWYDSATHSVIVPDIDNVYIFDVNLASWATHSITWNNANYYTSYAFPVKDYGTWIPFGWEPETNYFDNLKLPKTNSLKITKT
jgi:hypothetical protein